MTTRRVAAGDMVMVDGDAIAVTRDIDIGFKVAAVDLLPGVIVIRSATPIGRMTQTARRGDVVHTHNLESMYIRTHQRGEE